MTPRPVAACFVLSGFVVTSLYARLPAIKDRLDLSDGRLSLALLALTAGLLLAQPLTGALVSSRGSAPMTVVGAVGSCLAVVPPSFAGSLPALVAACLVLGYFNGTLDVAMNVQGVTVENALGRPILSRLHAGYSAGMLAAGALGVVLATRFALVAVAVAGLAVTLAVAPRLARGDAQPAAAAFARPTKALARLGAIAFAGLLCEGSVNDWSAVHLHDTLGAGSAAPLGLAAFALSMTIGRLFADRLGVPVRWAGVLACGALIAAALAPSAVVAIAAFAVGGLGLATVFPSMVRAAGSGPGIAAVSSAGYAGLVTGPPLIGAVADVTSLRASLAVILGSMTVAIVVLSR